METKENRKEHKGLFVKVITVEFNFVHLVHPLCTLWLNFNYKSFTFK